MDSLQPQRDECKPVDGLCVSWRGTPHRSLSWTHVLEVDCGPGLLHHLTFTFDFPMTFCLTPFLITSL